jgi:methyltransferase OMS1
VDTFGLCSFENPVAALREMSRVCRKGRGEQDAPPGKIYLLEHGRSDWAWLSNILDRHADPHAKRWGCYWNRDILAIVREAGLEIQSVARYHLGTTYVIVAAPPRRRR